jgi:predicted Ser/Thr protein kinase
VTLDNGTIVGSYRIDGLLGRGGMGVVYSARQTGVGRQVALKVLADQLSSTPDFVARFEREGRIQASLEHPHVVTVYEAGESEHGLYIAMRLVRGSTLAELMQEGTLDVRRTLALLSQVADALDAAHAAGLVHRDVKPQNVLVGDAGDAYLGDFGLTRVGGENGGTVTGGLVGTLSYLAPEVIEGRGAEPASDRYAFAAMLFEALTGNVVFPRGTTVATLFAHSSEPPPRISGRRPELPPALDELFARALSKNPGERPESAAALVTGAGEIIEAAGQAELGPPKPSLSALDENTLEPAPRAAPPSPRRGVASRVAVWLACGAVAGAAVALVLGALLDDDGEAGTGAPATLAGATVLGSSLDEPGRSVDCRGRSPRPGSPSCTIMQTGLPGRTLVVPAEGVIRRWAVRSARGEVGLSVVRSRSGETKQVARSQNEFVNGSGVHVFHTDLAVERGDRLGLVAIPGSAVGVRTGVAGAETNRWIPVLASTREVDFAAGTGFDDELLLRAELVPGGERQLPAQVTGARAAGLDPGEVRVRRKLRFANGRPVEIDLVQLGSRFVIDEFIDGRRTARIDVPDMRPGDAAALVEFEVYAETDAQHLGVYIEYVNEESARVLDHFFDAYPNEFDYID